MRSRCSGKARKLMAAARMAILSRKYNSYTDDKIRIAVVNTKNHWELIDSPNQGLFLCRRRRRQVLAHYEPDQGLPPQG
jgi:hypothetical protein